MIAQTCLESGRAVGSGARAAAHSRFVASIIARPPPALNRRLFRAGAVGADSAVPAFTAAHLFVVRRQFWPDSRLISCGAHIFTICPCGRAVEAAVYHWRSSAFWA
jgi:hypothetical protein